MNEPRIACERTYTLADGDKTPALVRWEVPGLDDRLWGCTYTIQSAGAEVVRRRIFGEDGVQALQLAMSTAAVDLLLFEPPVYWFEPDDDLGLPIPEAVRDRADAREDRRRNSHGRS